MGFRDEDMSGCKSIPALILQMTETHRVADLN
jgi:hypothetical protein